MQFLNTPMVPFLLIFISLLSTSLPHPLEILTTITTGKNPPVTITKYIPPQYPLAPRDLNFELDPTFQTTAKNPPLYTTTVDYPHYPPAPRVRNLNNKNDPTFQTTAKNPPLYTTTVDYPHYPPAPRSLNLKLDPTFQTTAKNPPLYTTTVDYPHYPPNPTNTNLPQKRETETPPPLSRPTSSTPTPKYITKIHSTTTISVSYNMIAPAPTVFSQITIITFTTYEPIITSWPSESVNGTVVREVTTTEEVVSSVTEEFRFSYTESSDTSWERGTYTTWQSVVLTSPTARVVVTATGVGS